MSVELALNALDGAVGIELGVSRWFDMDQRRIDQFAVATEDRQWIHIDPERAAGGPFGSTVAHGFLTLSLTSAILEELLCVRGVDLSVNYGLDRVRFPAPVPAGARLRGSGTIAAVSALPGGRQVTVRIVFEVFGSDKPVCVADLLVRYLGAVDAGGRE